MNRIIAVSALAAFLISPSIPVAQEHPRADDLNSFIEKANDSNTMVRLTTISDALRSSDYVMRSLAYEEAFTDDDPRIWQMGARSLLTQVKELSATIDILPNNKESSPFAEDQYFFITIKEFDENTGVGQVNTFNRRGKISVSQKGIHIKSGHCDIILQNYFDGKLIGSITCRGESAKLEVGMP